MAQEPFHYTCLRGDYIGGFARNFHSDGEYVDPKAEGAYDPLCWVTDLAGEPFQMSASEVSNLLPYNGFEPKSTSVTYQIVLQYNPVGDPYFGSQIEGNNYWWLETIATEPIPQQQFVGITDEMTTFFSWVVAENGVWDFSLFISLPDGTVYRTLPNNTVQLVIVKCMDFTFTGNPYFLAFQTSEEGFFDISGNVFCHTLDGDSIPMTTLAMWHDFELLNVNFDFEIPVSIVHQMNVQRGHCDKQETTCIRVDEDVRFISSVTVTPTSGYVLPTSQPYLGELAPLTGFPILETDNEEIFITMAPTQIKGLEIYPVVVLLMIEDIEVIE